MRHRGDLVHITTRGRWKEIQISGWLRPADQLGSKRPPSSEPNLVSVFELSRTDVRTLRELRAMVCRQKNTAPNMKLRVGQFVALRVSSTCSVAWQSASPKELDLLPDLTDRTRKAVLRFQKTPDSVPSTCLDELKLRRWKLWGRFK